MIHRALLVPAFGLAVAFCYAVGWLFLERALTPRVFAAVGFIGLAGTGAALFALLATHLLVRRPWTARFAAALLTLSAGTVGFTALLLGLERAWATHPMAELPVTTMLVVIIRQEAAALYNVLSLAGFVLLPMGFPTILFFAWVLAREGKASTQRATPRRSVLSPFGAPMIPRYSRPDMASIWAPETRFRIWFEIEAHALDAMAELGLVPADAARAVWEKGREARFDTARIEAIEREVKHDVIAFLTHLAEIVGPQARFIHGGMTSSDVLDTCLAVQLTRAADIILADLDGLLAALRRRAFEHKNTPTIGRSHAIHAEPTTFGLKLAYAYAEFSRGRERLQHARQDVATCAVSGAVGTFATVDPRIEAHVARKMGLAPEPISTQVIPRDRHAMFFATLGVIASSIERLATEIRHLQRTEVREVEEFFAPGQKGSSAMPHKRNPVLSENLTGLARVVRSYAVPAMENVALWHERDISHSSVERVIAPDATVTLDFALARLTGLIENLVVYPARMRRNLDATSGLIHSQRVLLALTQAGMSREKAYELVQRNAMKVWEAESDFLPALLAEPEVTSMLPEAELRACFDLDHDLRHVDTIFQRVFG